MKSAKQALRKYVPPSVLIHAMACNYYFSGPPEIRYLAKLCQRDRNSIDIGANIGVYTYFMRRHSRHVHAYEPNPDLASKLKQTFPRDVSVHPIALSNTNESKSLRIPVYNGLEMHGLASLAQDFADADRVSTIEVQLRTLDEEDHKDVGFVKIDVEQHEIEVLDGAKELLKNQKPNVLVEVAPLLYEHPLDETFEYLLSLGYSGYFLFAGKLLSLSEYDTNIHNRTENLGSQSLFLSNIMFVAPNKNL